MALSEAAKKIASDLGKNETTRIVTIERRLAAAKQLGIADDIEFWTLALRAAETVEARTITAVKIERVEWIDGVEEGDTPPPGHWASTSPPQHPDSVVVTKRR